MNQNYTIPDIYCPFPSAISPFADRVNQHTLEWVRKFGLVSGATAWQRLQQSKFGRLASRAYPYAPPDRLEIVSDWNTWLFVLDDQCDEWGLGKEPEKLELLHRRCLQILAGTKLIADDVALVHAIHDIRTRVQPLTSLAWMTRFVHSASEYFESTQWEAENRRQDIWPDADAYIRLRPYTGGLLTDIDLIEMTESISLPLMVRKHPCILELIDITNNVVCWSNDIISLRKEFKHRDRHNLALIFNHNQAIDMQAAIDRVSELIEKEVRRFILLEQSLPRFDDNIDVDVDRFVGVLRAWMRGNLDWSFESGRYLPTGAATSIYDPIQVNTVDMADSG
ncbi:MAG: terpene synthase family protein [Gammaproteobacteria bacterium]